MRGKNLRQLHAAGALDLPVEFHERNRQRLRRELAERGLAGTAQAHQRDAALGRRTRLAEALRQHAAGLGNLRRGKSLELMNGQCQIDGPLGLVADELGNLQPQGVGDLAQDERATRCRRRAPILQDIVPKPRKLSTGPCATCRAGRGPAGRVRRPVSDKLRRQGRRRAAVQTRYRSDRTCHSQDNGLAAEYYIRRSRNPKGAALILLNLQYDADVMPMAALPGISQQEATGVPALPMGRTDGLSAHLQCRGRHGRPQCHPGARDQDGLYRSRRNADLRRAQRAHQPDGQPGLDLRHPAQVAGRPADARYHRFPGRVLGRASRPAWCRCASTRC